MRRGVGSPRDECSQTVPDPGEPVYLDRVASAIGLRSDAVFELAASLLGLEAPSNHILASE